MSLPTDFQKYIHISRYARWLDDKGRRETWEETVRRYFSFWENRYPWLFELPIWEDIEQAVLNLEVMPSMRALMTAGPALEKDNIAGYNCAYIAADNPRALDETVYVLMCGTGVGFSVERQYVSQLPEVSNEFYQSDTIIKVKDSKIGWASAYRELISLLYAGQIPRWDLSKVRPAGARLKTFGGRSSGPKPLDDLFKFTIEVFKKAAGRRLQSIEVHDLFCKIADIVVVGGVRRSALISLSNLTDERMRVAKSGSWWIDNPQRALSNNSVCYTEKPDIGIFMREWLSLYDSKSGERGIFSRDAAKKHLKRNVERRDPNHDWGCNPCSEILLRSAQCCNLTEVVARVDDSFEDLERKVEYATILGTLQSTLTELRYLRPVWKKNMEEERLLGVSLTGIMDHPVLSKKEHGFEDTWEEVEISEREYTYEQPKPLSIILKNLKEYAIEINQEWASKLNINPSTAITCVKPSGTVSQLVNSASGIHPRFSRYYIRTVRVDKKDPLYHYMKSVEIPVEDELLHPESTAVFSFPIKSPDSSILVPDRTAIEQLELWKIYAEHWCEHKPSVTIYVREDEWFDVGAWCYKNFDILSGVSFLPYSGHSYQQAPYQEIDEATYLEAVEKMPKTIDWLKLQEWENEDTTSITPELACSAGVCEL